MPASETLAAAAAAGGTLALFLSIGHVAALVDELVGGPAAMDPTTPVVVGHQVTWPDETVLRTTLGELVDVVAAAGLRTTTMLLVGPALAEAEPPRRSHVYAPSYATRYRPASGDPTRAPV